MAAAKSKFKTQWALWATALVLLAAACTMATWPSSPAPAPASQAATKPISFDATTMTIKGQVFNMEVATSGEQQERGLMFRSSMPADHGMLFVMGKPDTWSFWMKDTWIPLDIVFLDAQGKVVEVQARMPRDETGMGPKTEALYIVELNLGVADKIGLKAGDRVEIPKKYVKN